ncbi:MAG: hypothetical protein DPW09_44430 [Anaerolineae bacterium]|nr:hypothetical protein [Anaerolineae bacterium]
MLVLFGAGVVYAAGNPLEVYNDASYSGMWCYSVSAGPNNIASSCNDQMSSVALLSGWSVRLYRDANQSGPSRCFSASDANLTDNTYEDGSPMNDTVSSFILYQQSGCPPLEVHNNANYTGSWCYSVGAGPANIASTCNDQVSSILLMPGWSLRVYRDANQGGPSRCFTTSDPNLTDNSYEDGSPINDTVSSFNLYAQASCPALSNPVLQVNVGSIGISATQGGANPAPQPIIITNGGTGVLNWTASDNASWITLSSISGTAPSTINALFNLNGLNAGTYNAQITVNSSGAQGSPKIISVSLNLASPPPDIQVNPTSFSVNLPAGQLTTRNLTIQNTGSGSLTFQLSKLQVTSTQRHSLKFPAEKIDPDLLERTSISSDQPQSFLVYLTEQADLSQAETITDWTERGNYVYETLWHTASENQVELRGYLDNQIKLGQVANYRPFYIVNAIAVTGNSSVLTNLAVQSRVAYIEAIKITHLPQPVLSNEISAASVEWGISKIRADQVWANFGIRGARIVVANIDSGVLSTHPALKQQYRGAATGSHNYNWFDPTGIYPNTPGDNTGHGTHTMGTMVGNDGGNNQIGVAPAAQWIAAKGCVTNSCEGTDLLAAAEWILAPYPIGGSPAQGNPAKRPNIVNNSWGGGGGQLWYQAIVAAWRTAGIFPAFSAGNSGPDSGSISSPGDYAESFASGATDSSDTIANFSSRGPSSLTGETKPDLSAPGVNVRSALNSGSYASWNGTSMASPHTAGCAALILSAAPGLSVEMIENSMTSTAVDLGTTGPDYTYGYGRLDCLAAVTKARTLVPWLTLNPSSGTVSSGGSKNIQLIFDATRLTPATYQTTITITSNDPDESPLAVPVTLIVGPGSSTGGSTGKVYLPIIIK